VVFPAFNPVEGCVRNTDPLGKISIRQASSHFSEEFRKLAVQVPLHQPKLAKISSRMRDDNCLHDRLVPVSEFDHETAKSLCVTGAAEMMVKCPECVKEVSDTATSCPHCGYTPPTEPANVLWYSRDRRPCWPTPTATTTSVAVPHPEKCERCGAIPQDGFLDECAVCRKELCENCMEAGCCGCVPAKSGLLDDDEEDQGKTEYEVERESRSTARGLGVVLLVVAVVIFGWGLSSCGLMANRIVDEDDAAWGAMLILGTPLLFACGIASFLYGRQKASPSQDRKRS